MALTHSEEIFVQGIWVETGYPKVALLAGNAYLRTVLSIFKSATA